MLLFLFAVKSLLPNGALSVTPPLPQQAHKINWQAPSGKCTKQYGIDFRLSDFKFSFNPRSLFQGSANTIWYDYGVFPHNDYDTGMFHNGAVPQSASLKVHLSKAVTDIGWPDCSTPACDYNYRILDDDCDGDWVCIEGTSSQPVMSVKQVTLCTSNGTLMCGYGPNCTLVDAYSCAKIDSTYDGDATMNFEWWRPEWETNWSPDQTYYRTISEDLVKKDVAFMNPKNSQGSALPVPDAPAISAEAQRRFENAARPFITQSLELGKLMRPNARWGYYHYPYCFNGDQLSLYFCTSVVESYNNNIWYLFYASTAIMPSVYLYDQYSEPDRNRFIFAGYCEAVRVSFLNYTGDWRADLAANKSIIWKPVLPYITYKRNYTDTYSTYTNDDLFAQIRFGAEFGFDGAFMWGPSVDFADTKDAQGKTYNVLCEFMRNFTVSAIGPYAKMIIDWANTCSTVRCNGHGRCAHIGSLCKNTTIADQMFSTLTQKNAQGQYILRTDSSYLNANYFCKCYSGYRGQRCELQ